MKKLLSSLSSKTLLKVAKMEVYTASPYYIQPKAPKAILKQSKE